MKIIDLIPFSEKSKSPDIKKFIALFDNMIDEMKDFISNRFNRDAYTCEVENLDLLGSDRGISKFEISETKKRNLIELAPDIYQYKGTVEAFKFLLFNILNYDVDVSIDYAKLIARCNDINSRIYSPDNQFMSDNYDTQNDIIPRMNGNAQTTVTYTINNYDGFIEHLNILAFLIRKYMSAIKDSIVLKNAYMIINEASLSYSEMPPFDGSNDIDLNVKFSSITSEDSCIISNWISDENLGIGLYIIKETGKYYLETRVGLSAGSYPEFRVELTANEFNKISIKFDNINNVIFVYVNENLHIIPQINFIDSGKTLLLGIGYNSGGTNYDVTTQSNFTINGLRLGNDKYQLTGDLKNTIDTKTGTDVNVAFGAET